MNNWDLYDMIDGRNFQNLMAKLKAKYSTFPVEIVQWGMDSLGKPFVVVKRDRADKSQAKDPNPEPAPVSEIAVGQKAKTSANR